MVDAFLKLEQFVEVQSKDNEGWTALHHAASSGHMDVIEVLLQSSRFTGILDMNNEGKTAYDLAVVTKHFDVASALRQYQVLWGSTSLHSAHTPVSPNSTPTQTSKEFV